MYNKYRITVVVLMVVRSSRMQRTRTIAAAIKSIYYARVCYIRATYSLPLSVSFSLSLSLVLSLSRLFLSIHTHSLNFYLPFSPPLSLSLSHFSFTFSRYCKFLLVFLALPHLIFFYLRLIIIIIIIVIIIIIAIIINDRYVFGRKSSLLSSPKRLG